MSDIVGETPEQLRVCPRCGVPAGAADHCSGCGLHIAVLPELPTRAQWLADRTATAPTAHAQRDGGGRSQDGHAQRAAHPQPVPAVAHTAASIRPLLHPTEQSRLVLALVASGLALLIPILIVVSTGSLIEVLVALAIFVGSIWFTTQLFRARLLGQSVRVDASTFPELQQIVDEVCDTLQYRRRVEVYVIEAAKPNIITTSLLGTRMILIEGGLVADLLKPGKQAQLTFLVGRSIGALRAKHARLSLLVAIMQTADVLKYVTPFILPYYRAIAYSGDQIGMMCCSDLGAALEATRRLLVGGQLAGELTAGAVLPQALLVKRRILPRLVQLLASEPHVTNRYANLLCFGRYHDPQLWLDMRSSMDERELGCLDDIWQRSPYRWRIEPGSRLS